MSWPTGTVPTDVSAARDSLGGSASWVAAGGVQAQIHYPTIDLRSATLPAALIIRKSLKFTGYGDGSGAIPMGEMELVIYSSLLIGGLEDLANKIAQDLPRVQTGLLIRPCEAGMASDVQPSETAPQADGAPAPTIRCITIPFTHGLNA